MVTHTLMLNKTKFSVIFSVMAETGLSFQRASRAITELEDKEFLTFPSGSLHLLWVEQKGDN